MLANILSGAVLGIEAYPVTVEVDLAYGMMVFNTVGLPGNAVCESRTRVKTALKNSGYDFPNKHITINLAPANIRKEGTVFDLPIALGILAADGQIPESSVKNTLFAGELSLDGSIHPFRGVLPLAACARENGLGRVMVPAENASEAAVVEGIDVIGVRSLHEAVSYLRGETKIDRAQPIVFEEENEESSLDMRDVHGQPIARRALEIAAAGGHNLLFIGPPGAGKTMLARRLPTIVPPMTFAERLESSVIASIAGLLRADQPLMLHRPFRAPHHNLSDVALIGGGPLSRPGEVSLAHNGVLFLDELPEFKRCALESLRQPLEDGEVVIARAQATLTYPSRFMLVAAMNPCPCGYFGHPRVACNCTSQMVQNYRNRISGPLFDRIDLQIPVDPSFKTDRDQEDTPEDSATIRKRVIAARALQTQRLANTTAHCNAQMTPALIHEFCTLDASSARLLDNALDRYGLSARAHDRILRVARTIADLDGEPQIAMNHLAEAIQYRQLDREVRS